MSREDGANQGPLEMFDDLIGVDPAISKLPERRFGALVDPRRIGRPEMSPDGPDPSLLLGQVDEVKINAESPDQSPEITQPQLSQTVTKTPGLLGRRVASKVFGRRANFLDKFKSLFTGQTSDRLAQETAEKMDIAAKSFQGLGPHDDSG
jgi:hypothetical protein